jgi:Putative glucoamylase
MKWFASDYLGIDQGPIVLMIENYRSGRIWNVFMQHAAIQRGLGHAGFVPVTEVKNVQTVSDIASQTPLPEVQPAPPDVAPQAPQPEAQPANPDMAPQTPQSEAQPAQQRS